MQSRVSVAAAATASAVALTTTTSGPIALQRANEDDLLYAFTVEDPTVWSAPWSGEYPWPGTPARVYEYACHEGNYAMGNILRGARLLEDETRGAASGGQ